MLESRRSFVSDKGSFFLECRENAFACELLLHGGF